ncbi:uncharacterized protein MCYG_06079 [Microsporum canis CBS 113480]|uniref:Uncharacterized protein n=1 Tax=Arthroderma otae (strain ATCC MYA-4605 / CBS 113480) TaxID=554155 RepID=C5FTQ7_ARTOC|nr:uncharacterized protein MCYG_06079 [Microsporum canis CBS 113480]EEQ33260.1 predicted protein [Microsporum canis CBS 113480]
MYVRSTYDVYWLPAQSPCRALLRAYLVSHIPPTLSVSLSSILGMQLVTANGLQRVGSPVPTVFSFQRKLTNATFIIGTIHCCIVDPMKKPNLRQPAFRDRPPSLFMLCGWAGHVNASTTQNYLSAWKDEQLSTRRIYAQSTPNPKWLLACFRLRTVDIIVSQQTPMPWGSAFLVSNCLFF